MKLEQRNTALEIKKVSANGEFEGYGSVFDVVDAYQDVVVRGAFTRTLRERGLAGASGVKMLWQHDRTQPIGRWLDMKEDSRGLYVRGKLSIDSVAQAKEAYGLLKDGAIGGLSIGFNTRKHETDPTKPEIRRLTDVDLWEVSIVTFAANIEAAVSAVKNFEAVQTPRHFERFLRDAGVPKDFAKLVTNHGFDEAQRIVERRRDVGDDEADLAARIGRTAALLRKESRHDRKSPRRN